MRKPYYSIIIPTLNEGRFLPKLLASIGKQTKKGFEVLVVDSSASESTVHSALRFRRVLPLRIIKSEVAGVSRQRNLGAREAHADWLVFVDADSILLPHFIERIDAYIRFKRSKFFTTWCQADGDKADDAIMGLLMNISIEGAMVIDRPWAPGPLTVVRRDIFDSVGGYDENASFGEDHDFAMMITEKGTPFTIFREILYIYSFRRFRKEGALKVSLRNLASALHVLFTRRSPKNIRGFTGGGQLYENYRHARVKSDIFNNIETKLKKFLKDIVIP